MGDSAQTSFTPAESSTLYSKLIGSNSPQNSRSPTQTLDRYNYARPKVDTHASAHMLFDKIAQETDEKPDDDSKLSEFKNEKDTNPLMSTEVLEDSDEPLVSSPGAEANTFAEPRSPLLVDGAASNIDDETDAWISCNRNQSEVYRPWPAVASSSSTWYEDAYDRPSMVGAGLVNLGNTCFFNAVLQCFTHSVLLVQGLYSYIHPTPCDCSNERFCLICALREHMELSLSPTRKTVKPWKLVDNLSYFSSSFHGNQQEDAHEFLQCFLDRLESSLSNLKTKDDAHSSQNENLVKQVFGGRVISKLSCCNCNHVSDTYEPSVDLSLEIEDANSLLTALDSFTKVEHIEDEEMKFTCDQCKQKVSIKKQLILDQIPPICAFHLKRFKNDGSYVEKIDKHVEFPLELDLQAYTCGNESNNVDLKYELYGVVVHAALTHNSGHYYCYIRPAPGTWYKFDDSKVTSVSEACVLSDEAYILFYTRQGTPWFSNFLETYKPSLDPNLSNTSPKSVLENVDHTSVSLDPPNIHSHDINPSKSHPFQPDAVVPLGPINHEIKKNTPLTVKEYGSNHRLDDEKNTNTPVSDSKTTFDIEQLLSPSTPPRSPGIDISDDDNSGGNAEVVFAAKPEQLKLAEKASYKRPRNKEHEDSAKLEALRQCKRMPGVRGTLLMAALETHSKSESLPKKSKKMVPSPRKNYSKSSSRFKQHDGSFSRNLATSFR